MANTQNGSPSQGPEAPDLQAIIDSTGMATLVLDSDLHIRFFTRPAMALFALTDKDLGQPIDKIVRRYTDDDLSADARTVMISQIPLSRDVQAESGVRYSRRLMPYRTASQRVQGVVMTFIDISEMWATTQESEAALAYSKSIVDTIHQPLVVLDHELRVVSASPSFYRSFAIMPGNAIGRQLPELRDRCLDVQALRSFLERIAAGHDVGEDYEIEIELPPHGSRTLQLNAREIAPVHGAKPRTLLAIDDVTDRKRIRTTLEAAKKQAERANLGKSRFLAAASHDLRQPLQTIALLQGILASKLVDAKALSLVARIGDSLDAMSGMLNKLLDINQLEAGVVKAEPENFSISELLERLRNDFSDPVDGKALRYRMVQSRHIVRSDPTLLEQMIRNLVSNARKYTASGKLLLGCRRQGDRLRIEIWDTGPGIPKEQLHAIFEEFHQLDNPARERARGLGLGLSIVQRLADLLGHKIDVRSWPGKGSVFSIEVPCIDMDSVEHTDVGQIATNIGSGDAILVVEDDPAIREALQLLFEMEEYRPTVVGDGASAIALVETGACWPRIVVTDYNLPNGLNGLEVALRLRQTIDQALPVLIVTGDIANDTLRAIADAECIRLNKPIKADELLRLVSSQLAMTHQGEAFSRKSRPNASGSGEKPSTVFLVEDDTVLREAMRELIEGDGRLVESFSSSEAFLQAYGTGGVGCLLVDARLPGLGGLALLQRLKADGRTLPSIMMTGHGEIGMAVEAMKAGAIDFIEKPVRHDELLASIDRALDMAHNDVALLNWRQVAASRIAILTKRERQIMDLVITGSPNKIIAADLNVSQRTVENHRASVMRKTRSKSISDLVRLAIASAD